MLCCGEDVAIVFDGAAQMQFNVAPCYVRCNAITPGRGLHPKHFSRQHDNADVDAQTHAILNKIYVRNRMRSPSYHVTND